MARRGLKRVGAWFSILALAIQSLIPVLLAAEIEIASAHTGKSVFTLCVFGHIHSLAHPGADGKSSAPTGDDDHGTVCPICIALQASPPFTAPAQIVLPLPSGRPFDTVVATARTVFDTVIAAAYRSRAPPLA